MLFTEEIYTKSDLCKYNKHDLQYYNMNFSLNFKAKETRAKEKEWWVEQIDYNGYQGCTRYARFFITLIKDTLDMPKSIGFYLNFL